MSMLPALLLAVGLAGPDPRIELVELQIDGRREEALNRTRLELARQPELAKTLGLDYLQGHLLGQLGRLDDSSAAFALAMGSTPRLSLHSRYRVALVQESLGHPEVAAGLVATVVAGGGPADLTADAVSLLARSLARGGDCRLLHGFDPSTLRTDERRRMELILGDCDLRAGRLREAANRYLALLQDKVEDETARDAAQRLERLEPPQPDAGIWTLLGKTFHQHRDFERSILYLDQVVRRFEGPLDDEAYDIAYARARGHFWREEFRQSADEMGWLARQAPDAERRAKAWFQQGRSYELLGRRRQACESFREAYRSDPEGRWSDGSLFALLRALWLDGKEEEALKLYTLLLSKRDWRNLAARASLFLASSELVQGRSERAGAWLDEALHSSSGTAEEVAYWRGRLAELEDRPRDAVASYAEVLATGLYHPLGGSARRRLVQPSLTSAVLEVGLALAGSSRSDDLYRAYLLLGPDSAAGRTALRTLERRLARDRIVRPFLSLELIPPQSWPLWSASLRQPDEMILAMGIWDHGAGAVSRHFPIQDPNLAFTASVLLARAGQIRRSILVAEVLENQIPKRLPELLHGESLGKLLYPLAYQELLFRESQRHNVDPFLLAAIIREESRYDARALSAASARGLTQFIQPTARRIAEQLGLPAPSASDLYRPAVSISLGAAYVSELGQRFGGRAAQMVAAYNAGEPQAELWRSYCLSDEPEEYFTKVGFSETRGYLTRVLGSWARYRALYLPSLAVDPAAGGESIRSTTGGSSDGSSSR